MVKNKQVFDAQFRPIDGEHVIYYFEPFMRWYTGTYNLDSDSVSGKNGFTTWQPEVTLWMKADEK